MRDNNKKRVDVWREQYRIRRYLEHVSEEDLGQRLRDIINNSIILTDKGQAAFRLPSEGGGYWMMKLIHIREEFLLRGHYFPKDVFKSINLPEFTYPDPPKSTIAIQGKDFIRGKHLIRYGKIEHLQKFFNEGILRIAPASSYKDSSLNHAMRDDELTLTTYRLPKEVRMTVIDQATGEEKGPLIPTGNIVYHSESKTNYYVFCLSMVYDHRLFQDFEADSCIIINNPNDFLRRLWSVVSQYLSGWRMFNMSVTYIDPFNTQEEEHVPFFTKNFKYAYQFEYRFAWLPQIPSLNERMEYLFLKIGSIKDIAELIVI